MGGTIQKARNTTSILVPPGRAKEACVAVASLPGLYHLTTVTAVDLGPAIELMYHFWKERSFVTVKTEVGKDSLTIESLSGALPSATLYEAEIQDLFGVTFAGNPYAGRRLLLPDGYPADEPPPLRSEADPRRIRRKMKLE